MPLGNSKGNSKEERLARLKKFQFRPGQSGNPDGRPKNDLAKQIAQAVFENDPQQIGAAMLKALAKGNPKAFTALADRAYGKTPETVNLNVRDIGAEERIRELLQAADARRAALSKP